LTQQMAGQQTRGGVGASATRATRAVRGVPCQGLAPQQLSFEPNDFVGRGHGGGSGEARARPDTANGQGTRYPVSYRHKIVGMSAAETCVLASAHHVAEWA